MRLSARGRRREPGVVALLLLDFFDLLVAVLDEVGMACQPLEGVLDDGVLVVLVENLVQQAGVHAQALVGRADLLEELEAVLHVNEAVVGAVQDEDGVGELGGVLLEPLLTRVNGAEQTERHLLDDVRVGCVGKANGGVGAYAATQLVGDVGQVVGVGLDGGRGQALIVAGPSAGEDVAVDGAREHGGVHGCCEAAHAVADDVNGSHGVFDDGALDDFVDILRDFLEVGVVDLLTLGTAVAAMVEAVDGIALGVEAHGQVVVAALVLAQAVDDDYCGAGIVDSIGLAVQFDAVKGFERVFNRHGIPFPRGARRRPVRTCWLPASVGKCMGRV